MALGMKKWLGLVAVCMALVAIRTLPPEPLEVPSERLLTKTQAQRRLDALLGDAARANLTLQRMRWADRMIPATLADGGPVTFSFPEGVNPDDVERVRERVLEEARTTPSDVAAGLLFHTGSEDAYPGAPGGSVREAEYYFGERDGRAFCVTVRPVWRMGREGELRLETPWSGESDLGLCALVRRFGLPGPAVEQWLAGGGTALAGSARTATTKVVPAYLSLDLGNFNRRGPFGQRPLGSREGNIPMDRCFAGVVEGCADLFLNPPRLGWFGDYEYGIDQAVRNSPLSAVGVQSWFYPADQYVTADLAEQFGDARFRAWWTADGDVSAAFQAAFGTDVGSWYLQQVAEYVPISRPGPGVGGTGLLGALLLLTLSTVLAGGWARRRRVA